MVIDGNESTMKWDRSMHKYPCPETDHIDRVLNDLEASMVTLTDSEINRVTIHSKRVLEFHKRRRSNHRYGADSRSLEAELHSWGAECACARRIGILWKPNRVGDFDYAGDLGEGLQVRHTLYQTGKLILHPKDKDDHTFFLVIGPFPTYRVAGFILCGDGKRESKWLELQRGRGAYVVDQDLLKPVSHYVIPNPRHALTTATFIDRSPVAVLHA